jgi:hypothetical protein
MPRVDYRRAEHEVPLDRLLRAAVRVLMREINVLRVAASLPPLTAAQVKERLRQELNDA